VIERVVARTSGIEREVERLSAAYRGDTPARAARTPPEVAAYLAYRAPATYAAAAFVFRHVARQRPEWRPRTSLDVGSGPGTATWAALAQWPSLEETTLVEVEPEMLAAGRELLPEGRWVAGDVDAAGGGAELVLVSYVLGELPEPAGAARRLWERTADTIVLIEPGTPVGYRRVLDARAAVIETGGHTVAPCPHDLPCPLPADDWCHFAARLPRSRLHRRVKGAELGWEDEKLSYAVLSREPVPRPAARIIRPPQVRSGHVRLVTSDGDGAVRERTVSRKQGDVYRAARKAGWGDAIEP
jgi:ribosomal protein RSM22 (predicted rRNA methylase)